MGQAKRRGTFEERVEQAKAIQLEELRQRREKRIQEEEAEQARVDAMTEEEREVHYTKPRRTSVATMLAMAALIGGPYH